MDPATREAICAAAVRAAQAVDYVGAGTIEFIADASEGLRADRIWFMEMNTRLQVEHPVTEEITGVDLVEWQLRVASGEPLPLRQEELSINGWAMEARLYAEDPAKEFLPSIGKLELFEAPDEDVRLETGVAQGDAVSSYYDPMIAKIVSHGDNRQDAIDKLAKALNHTVVWPVKSNGGFLYELLNAETFQSGSATTNFIGNAIDDLLPSETPPEQVIEEAAAELFSRDANDRWIHGTPETPWVDALGFRLNRAADARITVLVDRSAQTLPARITDDPWPPRIVYSRLEDGSLIVTDRGQPYRISHFRTDGGAHHSAHDGDILSPMPGKIIAVEVAAGDTVTKGQKLLTLEAMKMEHTLTAPFDGVVAELSAVPGAQVQVEALLARIEAAE